MSDAPNKRNIVSIFGAMAMAIAATVTVLTPAQAWTGKSIVFSTQAGLQSEHAKKVESDYQEFKNQLKDRKALGQNQSDEKGFFHYFWAVVIIAILLGIVYFAIKSLSVAGRKVLIGLVAAIPLVIYGAVYLRKLEEERALQRLIGSQSPDRKSIDSRNEKLATKLALLTGSDEKLLAGSQNIELLPISDFVKTRIAEGDLYIAIRCYSSGQFCGLISNNDPAKTSIGDLTLYFCRIPTKKRADVVPKDYAAAGIALKYPSSAETNTVREVVLRGNTDSIKIVSEYIDYQIENNSFAKGNGLSILWTGKHMPCNMMGLK